MKNLPTTLALGLALALGVQESKADSSKPYLEARKLAKMVRNNADQVLLRNVEAGMSDMVWDVNAKEYVKSVTLDSGETCHVAYLDRGPKQENFSDSNSDWSPLQRGGATDLKKLIQEEADSNAAFKKFCKDDSPKTPIQTLHCKKRADLLSTDVSSLESSLNIVSDGKENSFDTLAITCDSPSLKLVDRELDAFDPLVGCCDIAEGKNIPKKIPHSQEVVLHGKKIKIEWEAFDEAGALAVNNLYFEKMKLISDKIRQKTAAFSYGTTCSTK